MGFGRVKQIEGVNTHAAAFGNFLVNLRKASAGMTARVVSVAALAMVDSPAIVCGPVDCLRFVLDVVAVERRDGIPGRANCALECIEGARGRDGFDWLERVEKAAGPGRRGFFFADEVEEARDELFAIVGGEEKKLVGPVPGEAIEAGVVAFERESEGAMVPSRWSSCPRSCRVSFSASVSS